jgi:hypothetical protein
MHNQPTKPMTRPLVISAIEAPDAASRAPIANTSICSYSSTMKPSSRRRWPLRAALSLLVVVALEVLGYRILGGRRRLGDFAVGMDGDSRAGGLLSWPAP